MVQPQETFEPRRLIGLLPVGLRPRQTEEAHELIRLLLLKTKKQSELIDWAEQHRLHARCNWKDIRIYWESEFRKAPRPLDNSEHVDGIARMYLGAACHQSGRWGKAIQHYQHAEEMFVFENDWYRAGLSYMAQGLINRAEGKPKQARIMFQQAKREFCEIASRCSKTHDVQRSEQCIGLCGRVQDLIDNLERSNGRLPRAHLIPTGARLPDGLQAYLSNGVEARLGVISAKEYRWLSLPHRLSMDCQFNASDTYIVAKASSEGTTGFGIHHNDLLIARETDHDAIPARALVRIKDQNGVGHLFVSLVRVVGDQVHIQPANPTYQPQTFRRDSAAFSIVGELVAVAERVDG